MCSVDGCSSPAKSKLQPLCKKHYMRQWRSGTTDLVRSATRFRHSGGYIMVPAKDHPMARGSSHAYEHRRVYFDAHGEGPFSCHWCGVQVDWSTLHIDHLDDDKANNTTANLAASCPTCNQARGRHKAKKTWAAKSGLTALGQTKTLNDWSKEIGISRQSIICRLAMGWSADAAVSTPRGKFGPRPTDERTD